MPALTPLDVQHKEFARVLRGYAMAEVDTFLDQVRDELSRLLEENGRLRAELGMAGPATGAGGDQGDDAQPAATGGDSPLTGGAAAEAASEGSVARVLVLAQRAADQAVEEAQAKARKLVEDAEGSSRATVEAAEAEAARIVAEAETRARTMVDEAEGRVSAADQRAKELAGTAAERLRTAEDQARAKADATLEQSSKRRQELESAIEALRTFEREYRAGLRGFVERHLAVLDAPVDVAPPPQPPGPTDHAVVRQRASDHLVSVNQRFGRPTVPAGETVQTNGEAPPIDLTDASQE